VEHIAYCFSVRTELVFERNTSCNLGFSRFREAYFVSKGHVQWS
jgi:hypothetical protein